MEKQIVFWCQCQRVQIQSNYVEKNAPKSPYVCEKLILKSAYLDNGFQQACKAAIFFGGEFSLFGEFF